MLQKGGGITGGASTVTLTSANIPAHTHTFSAVSEKTTPSHTVSGTNTSDSHSHTKGTMNIDGSFEMRVCANSTDTIMVVDGAYTKNRYSWSGTHANLETRSVNGTYYDVISFNANKNWSGSTSSDSHTHSWSGTVNGGSHAHGVSGTTSSIGSGNSFSIMPPYETAYCWKRIS